MEGESLKYSSIAISGRPGAGRTTLLKNLKPYLEPLKWQFFSGGDWARQFAVQSGKQDPQDTRHHNSSMYADEIDRQTDLGVREKLSHPDTHMIVESWIAGWNARGFSHVLKVLLICDDSLRIDRVVNRDSLTVEEAKKHIWEREEVNLTKWKRMYKVDDFWEVKYYDLVINTFSSGPMETLGKVLDKLGYKNH